MRVYGPSDVNWSISHDPGANTQATITQDSPGGMKQNVVTGLSFMLAAGAVAPAAICVSVRLIRGASGGVNYAKQWRVSIPAVAGANSGLCKVPLWIPMGTDTAATLEFSAAGGANTFESVEMEGTVI